MRFPKPSRIGILSVLTLFVVAPVGYFAVLRALKEPVHAVASTTQPRLTRSSCRECHRPIDAEWRESFHFKSLTGPFWQRIRNKGLDNVFSLLRVPCVNCHAPANVLDLAPGAQPVRRLADRELGVDCVSCHVSEDGIVGPGQSVGAPHEVIGDERFRDPVLASTAICAPCHDEPMEHAQTVTLWKQTEQARRGVTCLDCHMPEVEAPSVEDGPIRVRRSHRFPGDKDPQMLRDGLNATLEMTAGRQAVLRIVNDRIGHAFPASGTNSLIVELAILDSDERPVRAVRREFGTREWIPGYLDFWPFLKVTKIPPGESRELRIDLLPGPGTVVAEFRYRDWFAVKDRDRLFHTIRRSYSVVPKPLPVYSECGRAATVTAGTRHGYPRPDPVMPYDASCEPPATGAVTRAGASRSTVVPSPSWPLEFPPQQ